MQKLSQTEELARSLAAKAHRHTLTTEQISRAMEEADFDIAQLDELYAALEQRGILLRRHILELVRSLPSCLCWMMPRSAGWRMSFPRRVWHWMIRSRPI